MSIESAKAFLDRMKTDEEFAKKVTACKNADTRMAYIKNEGFNFTVAEINTVKDELSDEELDLVAGGGSSWLGCDSQQEQ
ncbi:MAG: bacteriocin [Peptococcaceae bacterium BICA1-7]|nr:MAG: bacteriocin [Peptococcaceae bacterium BICA1-7]HBV97168.1 Nif11-like leader peptide family natural product precursor [Desulfotomaculum sp.]